ncbi:MAG: hypothetical protein IT367_10885 [Candidatus Hydrogenedentes bacterium]|nr:hypothetical protein [Candidatus Hydrogenedentota bacterium]
MNLAALIIVACSGIFELHSIPLNADATQRGPSLALVFFANADKDDATDLFVLEGNVLSVHTHRGEVRQTTFPAGVSIFDVVDLDADGVYEIVAVQGKSIIRLPIALQGEAANAVKLFDAESLYSSTLDGPVPRVLVIEHMGSPAIALPTFTAIQYRRVDGSLVSETPHDKKESFTHGQRREFGDTSSALELGYTGFMTFETFAGDQPPAKGSLYYYAESSYRSSLELRNAASEVPNNWPWFTVHNKQGLVTRAYCAVDESLMTLVRTCDVQMDKNGFPETVPSPGPARRYPGALVTSPSDFPDFNGDGYKDLLLWTAPTPGISVDALLRAVVGRNWPITLAAHMYSPSKGRFEPEAESTLMFRIPVTWFLEGPSPLRNPVFADFNGDKKTDLAMCTEENEYGIWYYTDDFSAIPDEKYTFKENITDIELTADVAGNGKTSIVLRSDRYVYALYAK